ncbi:hypothetical protein V2G26_001554 [Clonostachys chloroleuca]
MAPSLVEFNGDSNRTDAVAATSKSASTSPDKFALFRRLVPVASDGKVTFLNASFAPPANLITHAAITRYANEALQDCHPKPAWQTAGAETRAALARYINAPSADDIAFMRDTTEGLNSFIHSIKFQPGDNVVILDTEHPNHGYGWMAMRSFGLEVRQVPTIATAEKSGVTAATADTFAAYVDERTIAIGLSSIMFHSGQWNDVAGIAAAFRPKGIHVLVDMTQQVGFADVDVQQLGVSAAAFGMHKGLNCPTGLAALYVDPKVIPELTNPPPVVGYGAVQNVRGDLLVPSEELIFHPSARRFEHLNISLIAIAAARAWIEFYVDVMKPKDVEEHLFRLGDALRVQLKPLGIDIVGPTSRQQHAPHLYILDLHDSRWVQLLKDNNIIVTPYRLGIRVSFGFYNNLDDVERISQVLAKGVEADIPLGRQ